MAEDAPEQHAEAAFNALQQQLVTSTVSTTGSTGNSNGGPFRGKCLYKTGKCANERALKTSGAAHNLCDEHRRRQNEHQRKLDSKNRFSRKTKLSVLDKVLPPGAGTAAGGEDASTPSSPSVKAARYSPHEKKSSRNRYEESSAAAPLPAAMKGPGPSEPQIAPVMMQAAGSAHALPVAVTHAAAQPPPALPPQVVPVSSAPQMSYPYMMQDFDGIVVPLPSYVEGHERAEFRARIYQKVLDYISEECIRRFSGKMISDGLAQQQQQLIQQQQQQQHVEASPAGYFSPQPAQLPVVHYQSVVATTPQQQQQQHAVPVNTSTSSKSPSTSTPEREKRGRAKQAEVVQQHDLGGDESSDDSDDEPQPPPSKKHSRSGASRSSRDRPAKLNARSEV